MHKAIIYGKSRTAYGVRMDGACLRLVLDGGGAYLYGVPSEPSGPVRMAEIPVKAEELEGGDIVTYADGKGYRVGGALVSWTPEDAAFAVAMRAEAGRPSEGTKQHPDVTLKEAAALCGVSVPTVRNWEAGKHTPNGWPGRSNAVTLKAWAEGRAGGKRMKKAVMNATRHGDMDKVSHRVRNGGRWQEN